MHCTRVGLPGNLHAIACWDRPRARACSVCGVKSRHYKLCDYPVRECALPVGAGVKKTCDAPLCTSCAVHRDPDTDYCPLHARAAEGRLKL